MNLFNSRKIESGKKAGILKKIILSVFVLILMFTSFVYGMYITGSNKLMAEMAKKEAVYLGKVTGKYQEDSGGRLKQDVNFGLYWELWDKLKAEYVDKEKINEKEMFYGSLRGLAASLGDPYTTFMDPKDSQEFSNDLSGTFEGIGAEVGIRDDVVTVVSPLSGSPAEKAGLKAGDKILDINGESTVNMSVDKAVSKIRGPKDTKVKLTIYRQGFKETKDIEITRATIYVKSVKTEVKPDNIFVVTISNFNGDTVSLFKEAVGKITKVNPRGIILDLRNDPGGFLDSAVEVASEWLSSGETVVSEKFSDGRQDKYDAKGAPHLKSYQTVVLINGGSASASEIVAGALQDYGRAKIVGEKSYGKGSVQGLDTFSDGSIAKITVAKWLTPKGNSISEKGITPDIEIKNTDEDFNQGKDPQMDAAVNILLGKNPITASSTDIVK